MSAVRVISFLVAAAALVGLSAACGSQVSGTPKAAENVVAGPAITITAGRTASSQPTSTTSSPTSTAPPTGSDRLAVLTGSWEGEYTCAQGETGLRLTIGEPAGDTLPATFAFYPLPENPEAEEGAFEMLGSVDANDQLVFKQQKWINRPEGYFMVDIAVTSPIQADVEQLSGDVLHDTCKGFAVRRR
jgi:hypothetical protein